jgi:hypothetical protein
MAATSTRPPVPDQLSLLTGRHAGDVLQAALAPVGGRVLSWRADQVDYQPGRGSTVGYRVRVRWDDGRLADERCGAHTGPPPAGALVVGDGQQQVAVWRVPYDPYLPALATAYDPAAVAGLLRSFRLGDGPVRLRLRAYRPRRRAVVEAAGPAGRLFLKVVPPRRVEPLHQRHRLCTAAGVPVPPSLGYTGDGLLVLQALPGQPLRQALRGRTTPLPSPAAIVALLDRLPAGLTEAARRRSWAERAEHYAALAAGLLPAEADLARQLGATIAAHAGTGPTVPVHGDFYDNQLQVAAGRITGLLDIDTAGPGDRLDDLACLLGHLSVLGHIYPGRAAAINRLGGRYLAAFESTVDQADLRHRIAAVVLSLASGPHRVQQPGWPAATRRRLVLAQRWVESAQAQFRRST